jgi:hypothetical protein
MPDLLRLLPGLAVAQIDASIWGQLKWVAFITATIGMQRKEENSTLLLFKISLAKHHSRRDDRALITNGVGKAGSYHFELFQGYEYSLGESPCRRVVVE